MRKPKGRVKTENKSRKKEKVRKVNLLGGVISFLKHSATIRVKLILSFLVPIVFILILGIVSYQKAEEGIRVSYENATHQAINMTGGYIEIGQELVEALSDQYQSDNIKRMYLLGNYSYDIILQSNNFKAIKSDIFAKAKSDTFISQISLLSDSVQSATTIMNIQTEICAGYFETENGKRIKSTKNILWLGKDDFLDEKLGVGPDKYAMRLVRNFAGTDSIIAIDMDRKTVDEILNGVEFDKSGKLALVTVDGKEIIAGSEEDSSEEVIFYDKDFYQKAVASEEPDEYFYVKYNGEEQLFMYSKVADTGAMICAMIPKSTILSKADDIKQTTIVIVILACIIAVVIGWVISYGIDKTIRGIIKKLKLAAAGDLTVDFSTKRKDEFRMLIDEIKHTFHKMQELIGQVKALSEEVSEASFQVSRTSEEFLKTSGEISASMNEIEHGMMQQAKDAEECLVQMDNLSNKIEKMSSNTGEISKIAEDTKRSIQEGTNVTKELTSQTKQTINITTDIVKGIEDLDEKSKSIGSIINVISGISNQTNLLSLNASIEAARAGDVGKGFAVVASEIRNLAEQTKNSIGDIKTIIETIQENTKYVVETAKKAESVMILQDTAVKNTAESYEGINHSVDLLMENLREIVENVNNIEGARASTLGSIENISAVLEEIGASSNNVNQIASDQLTSVESLNHAAGQLNENSELLVKEVKKFTI